MDRQKKGMQKKVRRKRRRIAPKPPKSNRLFYILGIVFSVLIVLGILASITIVATKDYQKVSYIFYITNTSDPNATVLSQLRPDAISKYFSYVGYSCISLSNDT